MIPSPAEVVRFRALGAAGLRLCGVACLLLALRSCLGWVARWVADRTSANLYTELDWLGGTALLAAAGVTLSIGAARWARWLLPMPDSLVCPACG